MRYFPPCLSGMPKVCNKMNDYSTKGNDFTETACIEHFSCVMHTHILQEMTLKLKRNVHP